MTERRSVEVLADYGKLAVLRLEPRPFPGVLIPGDTLKSLMEMVEEAQTASSNEDRAGALEDVAELVAGLLRGYIQILRDQGQPLPFYYDTSEQ
jgi:hypothetical protein